MNSTIGWPDRLTFVRHGESVGNVANARAYAEKADVLALEMADPDVELSPLGVDQSVALGERFGETDFPGRPDHCMVSPYLRTEQTADHLLAAAGWQGVPRIVDERLRDREQGILDRLTAWGIRARFPEEAERRRQLGKFYYRPPGGESWADVALRIREVLRDLRLDHAGERLLLVTHDVPIIVARFVIENVSAPAAVAMSNQIVNCGLTVYANVAGELQLERFNDPTPVAEDGRAEVTSHPEQS